MRHPRLTGGPGAARAADLPPLVAVAHGSRDPRAAATIGELLAVARSRAAARGLAGVDVRAAFLDHCAPSLPQALSAVADRGGCVVVPLLLTDAYHSKSDIPAQLAAARQDVSCADTLGPHPLLLDALERRLTEAGVAAADRAARADTSVVLAAAGSSDRAANATGAALAARWQARGGWRAVVPAYASAAGPRPGEAVGALRAGGHSGQHRGPVVVATYLLAPGHFADKIRDAALGAGASAVSPALGAAPEVADVIMERYLAAVSAELSGPLVARAQLSGTDPW
jgi:sirohydrochlorin ferrochelatase